MTKHRQRGFTLVELIIVIAVIAILATITVALYDGAKKEARDLRNVDGMHKVADAIELFISRYQHFPIGGSGSSAAIGGATECIGGSNGFAGHDAYSCTVEDTLVANGYLPAGFIASLSPNTKYPYTDGIRSIMVYKIDTTHAMVMTSMENPTDKDAANFSTQLAKCYGSDPGDSYGPRGYGMLNGVCITYSTP